MTRLADVRVSVVITNHNYGQFLVAAIDSALNQDHAKVECVVVDDGSTDDSARVIDRYRDRVMAIEGPNLGQGHAVNAGFAAATGDVVIFLDADDRLHPSTARRVAEVFADRPHLARVQIPLAVIDGEGRPTGDVLPRGRRSLFRGDARGPLLSCPDDIVWQPTSGNAFSRGALEQILPMDAGHYRLCADYHLSTLAPLYGGVEALTHVGGDYRVHGANGHIGRTSLDRVRADIERTLVTRTSLIRHAKSLGLTGLPDDARDIRSVSHAVLRMLSLRLDRRRHPVAGDDLVKLARLMLLSASTRRDFTWTRRLVTALWGASLVVSPRPVVRQLARPLLGGPLTT